MKHGDKALGDIKAGLIIWLLGSKNDMDIQIGDVRTLETDSSNIRIIGLDEIEAFYDSYNDHSGNWLLSNSKTSSFYRLPISFLLSKTIPSHSEPLSDFEAELINPHLPLRTCILSNWQWSKDAYQSAEQFSKALGVSYDYLVNQPTINTNQVVLVPSGPKGGNKPAKLIKAENGKSFSALELLWQAHNIQAKYDTIAKNGVGIYRLGVSKVIPSYYLGEQYDRAGHNKP